MLIRRESYLATLRELNSLSKIRDNFPKYLITTDPGNTIIDGIHKVNAADWLLGKE